MGMDAVHDHMTKTVINCLPTATFLDVQRLLMEHRVSRILVVSPKGDPLGIISEKDVMNFLLTDKSMRGLEEMHAREAMSPELFTIKSNSSMAEAAQSMIEEKISSLVVEDGQLEGIITKADVVTYLATEANNVSVHQFMTYNPITAKPTQSIFSAIDLMLRDKISRVLVVDQETKPIGIITPADLTFADSMIYISRLYAAGGASLAPVLHSCQIAVKDFMTLRPLCVNCNSDLTAAAKLMTRHRISGLPVTEDSGKLVGVVTKTDMTRAVAQENNRLLVDVLGAATG
jgi:CBS domain-containing protein